MDTNQYDTKAVLIARYLEQGAVSGDTMLLGFELEHFIVEKSTLLSVPYATNAQTGKPGVVDILTQLAPYFTEQVFEKTPDTPPHLIALKRDRAAITLEPGAQLEISIGPAATIAEIDALYRDFRGQLDAILDTMGYLALECGYRPTLCAQDVALIPKSRYHRMDEHFKKTGKHGICMMRGTAASQVSIDYTDEHDAVRKLRIANALGPFFSFITDNTPVFESECVGYLKKPATHISSCSGLPIPYRMARIVAWDDCDPLRCLTPPGLFDDNFGFLSYAQSLLRAPAIFTLSPAGETVFQGNTPFNKAYPDDGFGTAEIEHILSLFFFDTRFKQYVEIRQPDSLPLAYGLAFIALIKGIFYQEAALNYYETRFQYLDTPSIAFAKSALRKSGYDASCYQRPASEWIDEMFSFARAGLAADEIAYLEPLAALVEKRATPLDFYASDAPISPCENTFFCNAPDYLNKIRSSQQ